MSSKSCNESIEQVPFASQPKRSIDDLSVSPKTPSLKMTGIKLRVSSPTDRIMSPCSRKLTTGRFERLDKFGRPSLVSSPLSCGILSVSKCRKVGFGDGFGVGLNTRFKTEMCGLSNVRSGTKTGSNGFKFGLNARYKTESSIKTGSNTSLRAEPNSSTTTIEAYTTELTISSPQSRAIFSYESPNKIK